MKLIRNLRLIDIEDIVETEEHDPKRVVDLADQIELEGTWTVPIALEETTLAVMDGHHRLNVAKMLCFKRVPCVLTNYDAGGVRLESWRPDVKVSVPIFFEVVARGHRFPYKTTRHIFAPPLNEVQVDLNLLR